MTTLTEIGTQEMSRLDCKVFTPRQESPKAVNKNVQLRSEWGRSLISTVMKMNELSGRWKVGTVGTYWPLK